MTQLHPHRVDLSQDIGFKGIFAAETQISKALAADLIEVFTGIKVERIRSMNRELIHHPKDGKVLHLDALFEVNDNLLVDMEMQNKRERYDPERMINYLSGMNQMLVKKGRDHKEGRCILILFCAYRFGERIDRDQEGKMRFPSGHILSQRLTLIHVDLSNVRELAKKQVGEMSQAERYKVYLKYSHEEKHWAMIQELCEKEEGLMAINEYVYNEQEEVKQFYELMHRLDEGTREREMREERRKREKAEYLVACMKQGYQYPQAEEMANQKYPDENITI